MLKLNWPAEGRRGPHREEGSEPPDAVRARREPVTCCWWTGATYDKTWLLGAGVGKLHSRRARAERWGAAAGRVKHPRQNSG